MNKRYPAGLGRVIAAAALAGALGACGVKGDLEPPPRANVTSAGPAKAAAAQPLESEPKVFSEQSSVRHVAPPSLIPKMPPEEWRKNREYQSAPQPKKRSKGTTDDEPFFLDRIL